MRILKYELTDQERDETNHAVTDPYDRLSDRFRYSRDQALQVQIFEKKQDDDNCYSKYRHVSIRYTFMGQEYYVSLFPASPEDNNNCYRAGKFNSQREDYDNYRSLDPNPEKNNLTNRSRYKTTRYTFTRHNWPLLNTGKLHRKLSNIIEDARGANTSNYEHPQGGPMNLESVAYTGDYLHPVVRDATGSITSLPLFFKLCATVCCRKKHNCTSLVVNLLDEAEIATDMSASNSTLTAFCQFFTALSLGYCAGELAQLIHYLNCKTYCNDNNLTDEILGTTILFIGAISSALLLFATLFFNRQTRQCLHNPLIFSSKAWSYEGVATVILALVTFLIHLCLTDEPFQFRNSSSELWGLAGGGTVGLIALLIPSMYTWCKDCKGGPTNPYGLKRLLEACSAPESLPVDVPVA